MSDFINLRGAKIFWDDRPVDTYEFGGELIVGILGGSSGLVTFYKRYNPCSFISFDAGVKYYKESRDRNGRIKEIEFCTYKDEYGKCHQSRDTDTIYDHYVRIIFK